MDFGGSYRFRIYFKIFSMNQCAAILGFVVLRPESDQIVLHGLLSGGIKTRKRCFRGSEVSREEPDYFLRRLRKLKTQELLLHAQPRLRFEALLDDGFISP